MYISDLVLSFMDCMYRSRTKFLRNILEFSIVFLNNIRKLEETQTNTLDNRRTTVIGHRVFKVTTIKCNQNAPTCWKWQPQKTGSENATTCSTWLRKEIKCCHNSPTCWKWLLKLMPTNQLNYLFILTQTIFDGNQYLKNEKITTLPKHWILHKRKRPIVQRWQNCLYKFP